jgi:hypothetical protein
VVLTWHKGKTVVDSNLHSEAMKGRGGALFTDETGGV